jgi:putative DNA primase/helicase
MLGARLLVDAPVHVQQLPRWSLMAAAYPPSGWEEVPGGGLREVVPEHENTPTIAVVEDEALVVPPPSNPMAVAREFFSARYKRDDVELLRHHRGDFHAWDGRSWPEAEDRTVRAELYRWLERAVYWKVVNKVPTLVPFEPTRRKLGDLLEAVAAIGHLPAAVAPPAWLDGEGEYPAHELVAMDNGILHLPSRTLLPPSPRLYVPHALAFGYDPDAPAPARWMKFMDELWPEDDGCSSCLAEIMGYILGGDTRQQKMFLIVGPKRSGKGTVARVLTGLFGQHNTTAPTLASLTQNFGMQDLVGKPLAVVSDARLGSRADSLIAVERLLSISGEDSITVDRKYRDPWTGKLDTRFLILTNEIPRFTDASGALASRFVLLATTQSFYGSEDPNLSEVLLAEAPAIFNWALAGLDRLNARGHFDPPAASSEAIRHLEDLASPVGAFVRDRCVVGPHFEADKDEVFESWKDWCTNEGRAHAGTKNVLARDLRAAVPGLRDVRPRGSADGDRRRVFQGLGLAPQSESSRTIPDHPDRPGSWSRMPTPQNRRSAGVVQVGPGSSPLQSEEEADG